MCRRHVARMPRSVDTLKARLLDNEMAPWEGAGLECRVTRILADGVVTTQVRAMPRVSCDPRCMHDHIDLSTVVS